MKFIKILIVFCLLIMGYACGIEELLKTTEAPVVSRIFSDAINFEVHPLDTVKFWVDASNPEEGDLSYNWSVQSGEIIGTRHIDTLVWLAPLTGGTYRISLQVSNIDKTTEKSENITVISDESPIVNITSPLPGSFIVQNSNITITASASHENGISQISFFVNDSLMTGSVEINGNIYSSLWHVDEEAGPAEIKVIATAKRTGVTESDNVIVNIEGVIPGKIHGN